MRVMNQVGFVEAFVLFWKNYVNFKGRSRRSEVWWVALWQVIIFGGLILLGVISLFALPILSLLIFLVIALYSLATIIPNFALMTRRFHDRGMSMLVPLINLIFSVVINILNFITEQNDIYQSGNTTVSTEMSIIPWPITLTISLIYLALQIFIFVICLLDSKRETNKYGPSPKYVEDGGHTYRHPHDAQQGSAYRHEPSQRPEHSENERSHSNDAGLRDLDDVDNEATSKKNDPYKY